MQRLNYTSIATVCSTDASTVELVLKEIVAQMGQQVRAGVTVRVSFRIGRVEIKA